MTVNVSRRRVRDPFNEKVRARIFDTYVSSSGSEHDAESDVVSSSSSSPSPLCLSYLIQNFLEEDSSSDFGCSGRDCGSDYDSDDYLRSDPTTVNVINDIINPTVRETCDPFRTQLLLNVTRGVEIFAIFRKNNKSMFNRNLMAYLREMGYNAGVCKTRWDSTGGSLTGGSYELIDVIQPDTSVRYIVEADFCVEFEMGRETVNYTKLRSSLPRVFVGRPEDVKRIVRVMCEEARLCMKSNGMSLPPWRKNRYMQAKWLGPYRRTTNHLPTNTSPTIPSLAVKCRSVGFQPARDTDPLYFPPLATTR